MTLQGPSGDVPLHRYRFGSVEFDEARLELRVGGLPVDMEPRPLQVLALLLRHAGEVVTKEEILESVWAGRVTVENVLPNAVAKLRKALGESNAALLLTQPRVGYRLTGRVERIAVGRRLASRFALRVGEAVPGREHFLLEKQLTGTAGSEVWLARHDKTQQARVYKFSADGAQLAALKREATLCRVLLEALGEREDIVGVVDWNFESAPFFLEYPYAGENLIDWDGGTRLAQMPLSERVELALQIAGALADAHGVGVLHKDLKPGNVLVGVIGEGWQMRLADFGSGRLLDPEQLAALGITALGLTQTQAQNSSSGTPLYLAPELVQGRAPTVQSDVYALGVLLYQIAGADLRKPLAPGWEADIDDPLLCEDIAAATHGNPALRLASVAELIARLNRRDERRRQHEEAQTVARRAEAAERALERSRARRPLLLAVMAVLGLGLGVSLWFYQRAADTARQLEREYRIARAVDDFMAQDLIGAANPAVSGRSGVTVMDAAKSALPHIEQRFGEAPEIRAALHQAMEEALAGLTDWEAAIAEGRQAIAAHLLAQPVDVLGLSEARIRLGWCLSRQGHEDEAAAVLKEAAADVVRLAPAHPETQIRYWEALSQIASDRFDGKAALELDRKAWALMQTLSDADATFRERIEFNLCESLRLGGDIAESEVLLRDLVARQTQHWGATHWKTQFTSAVLANNLMIQQRYDEALALLPPAIAALDAGLGRDSRRALMVRSILAGLYGARHQYAQALPVATAVYEGYARLSGENSEQTQIALSTLGVYIRFAGDPQAAEPLLRKSLKLSQSLYAADHPLLLGARYNLAACLLDLHRPAEVAPLLAGIDAAHLADSFMPAPAAPQALLDYQAGRLALERGDAAAALPLLRKSVAELGQKMSPDLEVFRKRDGDLVAQALAQLKR